MKIVVCAKFVPDATADRRFRPEDNTVDRAGVDGLLSELDEYAVEPALTIAETPGTDTEVTVLTVGPEQATDAVRRRRCRWARTPGPRRSTTRSTAPTRSPPRWCWRRRWQARGRPGRVRDGVHRRHDGRRPGDGVGAARRAAVTLGSEVTVDGQTVRIRRDGDAASETIEGTLPLVLSVTDQANEPRYPSFKGIMAAKKKPVETWSLSDLEL